MSEFTPPECPNPACTSSPFRYRWRGYYRRACDGRRVPRFECLGCRRRYSSQTFRNDYRHRRPELNIPIVLALDSKVTQRQIARTQKCNLKSVARRNRLFGAHFRAAHSRELARLKLGGPLVFDELETYEHNRIEKPITMCVVVDKDTGFIVHGELGTLPSRDRKRGDPQRKSESRAAVKRCMQVVAEHRDPDCVLHLISDCKVTYPTIISELLGGSVLHTRIPGKAKRNTANPMFPINHLFAVLRDGVSRLVRRTWAYSKKIECLADHFWIYLGFKNYIRPRTNRDQRPSAASKFGAAPRRYDIAEAIAWRGRFSLH